MACRNPLLAERARKRSELLAATEALLEPVRRSVDAGRLTDPGEIGKRVGKVIGKHKMGKHFTLDIGEGVFGWVRVQAGIDAEAALDGIYIIRTSAEAGVLDTAAVVETYKELSQVERAVRSMKTFDLEFRPIFHRLTGRVRAHAFICMLAYYLVWHLREAWAPLCFTDEERPRRADPVVKARRSARAQAKASSQVHPGGQHIHSFQTVLKHLATLTRNTINMNTEPAITYDQLTVLTHIKREAFDLIGAETVPTTLR